MVNEVCTIDYRDKRGQQQVDELLRQEGIRRDRNLSYTCGIFNADMELIATGSSFGNTLRCLAVSGEHQGEGLMNTIVSHLTERLIAQGHTRIFLYTKPQTARLLGDLGFYEVARLSDLVFMENRQDGFEVYLKKLAETRRPGRCAAVVMNANPFTRGHRYLIERASKENDFLHLFLLSEEAGPIPYTIRKKLVAGGIGDLNNVILHDSDAYIISAAVFPSYFFREEDTAILMHANLDLVLFKRIAQALSVTRRYAGEEPNSHVTGLYNRIMAEQLPRMGIGFVQIPRLQEQGQVISASAVRAAIQSGELGKAAWMLPESTLAFFKSSEAAPVIAAIQAMEEARHY